MKKLVFDMDGTIADLYNVENWLGMLSDEDPSVFALAKPMYDMESLRELLLKLTQKGWFIEVITWLPMDASEEYEKQCADVKMDWLNYHNFPWDEVHCVPYGTPKHQVGFDKCTRVLIDDNNDVREEWKASGQPVINANGNIMESLELLLI